MFEVGDIITAVQDESGGYHYGLTAGNWVGQVVRIENDEFIRVETITPRTDDPCGYKDDPGAKFTVHAKYFRLA